MSSRCKACLMQMSMDQSLQLSTVCSCLVLWSFRHSFQHAVRISVHLRLLLIFGQAAESHSHLLEGDSVLCSLMRAAQQSNVTNSNALSCELACLSLCTYLTDLASQCTLDARQQCIQQAAGGCTGSFGTRHRLLHASAQGSHLCRLCPALHLQPQAADCMPV